MNKLTQGLFFKRKPHPILVMFSILTSHIQYTIHYSLRTLTSPKLPSPTTTAAPRPSPVLRSLGIRTAVWNTEVRNLR